MNTQLKKIGLGLMLAAMPLMANSASAQWTQQGYVNQQVVNQQTVPQQAAMQIDAKSINTVAVDQNGVLTGQIVSIDSSSKAASGFQGLNVFFVRDGQIMKQAQTKSDGSFQIQGIQEGAYSFYAAGKPGIAAYGVYVTGQQNTAANSILQATVASSDYNGMQQILQSNVPAQVRQSVAAAGQLGAELQSPMQIRLINGRLVGQINSLYGQAQLGNGVQVHLIQNNQSVAQVQTNSQGQFTVPDVEPGVYDYVAASQNGFATGRFEAVSSQENPMTQVAYRKTAQQLEACLTCPAQATAQPIEYAMEPAYAAPVEYAGESIAYGGASGGSCGCSGNYSSFGGGGVVRGRFGGGGAGFGGGGLGAGGAGMGRLLMLGGVAGGIVAISDDDSGSGSNSNSN